MAIYIKDKNNILIFYIQLKKNHKPIEFNLNDTVIKSYSNFFAKYAFLESYAKKYASPAMLYNNYLKRSNESEEEEEQEKPQKTPNTTQQTT